MMLCGELQSCAYLQQKGKHTLADNEPPHMILIVADNLGWQDLGVFGNKFIETPNLGRLANTVFRFNNGYAPAPLCSASRALIITGLHPIAVNITEHIHGNLPAKTDQKLKSPPIDQALKLQYHALAKILKQQGYPTVNK